MNGSDTYNPDLDWSQVNETVRVLNLAVMQILLSMKEGDDSIGQLTDIFATIAGCTQRIQQVANGHENEVQNQQISEQCHAIHQEMLQAAMAFQFYDKITQRLTHVSHTLEQLSALIADDTRLYNQEEWRSLQNKIKFKHTMAEEHHLYDMVMQGVSIDDALSQAFNQKTQNDIELF